MAKLPNPEDAIVEIRKLRNYCLSPDHPRGRHKARVFASALGLTADDAEELREALLSATLSEEAEAAEEDRYGKRYVLDFELKTDAGTATVRSAPTSVGAKTSRGSRAASCSRREMKDAIDILDVVAITIDLPERGLYRGQVGTVVEILAPSVFEVEFSEDEGGTYATLALEVEQLLVLRYEPSGAR